MKNFITENVFYLILKQLVGVGGGFFLLKYLTNSLSPDSYGKFSLCLTVTLLINLVFYGGFIQAISRVFFQAIESSDIDSFYRHIFKSFLHISFLIFLLAGLLLNSFQNFIFEKSTWFLIVVYSVLISLIKIYDTLYNVRLINKISFYQ